MRPLLAFADTTGLPTVCLSLNHHCFQLEVADTPEAQAQGLMFRENLSPDTGMAFVYETPRMLTFWMKDCRIPLDILFFDEGRLVDYVDSAPPCQTTADQCPRYSSAAPADLVIELPAGTRQRLGLSLGSPLAPCNTAGGVASP